MRRYVYLIIEYTIICFIHRPYTFKTVFLFVDVVDIAGVVIVIVRCCCLWSLLLLFLFLFVVVVVRCCYCCHSLLLLLFQWKCLTG
jgi:hypothetical protein